MLEILYRLIVAFGIALALYIVVWLFWTYRGEIATIFAPKKCPKCRAWLTFDRGYGRLQCPNKACKWHE